MKVPAVICDIDGTLALRNPELRGIYDFAKAGTDSCCFEVRQTLLAFTPFYDILICSGREDKFRAVTEQWLIRQGVPYKQIFMRPTGDRRKDFIVKEEIYHSLIEPNYEVLLVCDDRLQVVNMWRSLGLKCFQVEESPD